MPASTDPIKPANRTRDIEYAVRDVTLLASKVAATGKQMLYLNIGDPNKFDFVTPRPMIEAAYQAGTPPWDIGRPQPAIAALAEAGRFVGSVLDVGCGTGETALWLAARGLTAWGVDASSTAIAFLFASSESRHRPSR